MRNNLKKMGIEVLVLAVAMGVSTIGTGYSVQAATVGQQLKQPESGWTRFNDSDSKIVFEGKWGYVTNREPTFPGVYSNDLHGNYGTVGSKVKFKFYGSDLRIITGAGYCYSGANVKIDGVDYGNFSSFIKPNYLGAYLFFEKLGLAQGYHNVEITSLDKKVIASHSEDCYFSLDAIDINSTGSLVSYNNTVVVSSITLNKNEDTLEVGKEDQLTATVNPSNAEVKNVIWTSSNPAVATVDNTGKVKAVAEGDAVITAKAAGSNVQASCNIKVKSNSLIKDKNLRALINETLGKDVNSSLEKEDLEKVTVLVGDNKGIESLDGLQYCTNLQWLYIPNNPISDLTPLKDLKELNTLYAFNSNVSDLSPLANLTKLDNLSFSNAKVSDISPLEKLTNLKKLYLDRNEISDISALKNLTSLEYLALSYNKISDISALENLTNLVELSASDNKVSDISSLAGLTKLNYLSLSTNEISDVSPLVNLKELKTLYLFGNKISDFSPIEEQLDNIDDVVIDRQNVE